MSHDFSSLLPKKQINADLFLNDHRKWDGSLTKIAVWDTGIDPTAAGLQITPDGRPKIVDMIDASGSGDVKMKCKRYIDGENRIIETLTGRKVKIPSHWNPSDNTIRVGVKLASELFPKPLMQRLRNENRDNFWRPSIKRLMANLACDMDEAEEYISEITQNYKHMSNLSTDEDNLRETIQTNINKTLNDQENSRMEQKIETFSSQTKSNLSKQLKDKNSSKRHLDKSGLTPSAAKVQLKAAARSLEDSLFLLDQHYSPMEIVYDCFVFHNGNEWVACVDTSPYDPNKTLSDLPLLRDYTVNREYASFGEQTQLYYTVKVFDNGKLLQIVTNNSSHGTHVAAIAAAYFPNDVTSSSANASGTKSNYNTYDRNGVAPGAQIVSIKISDGRLGTMETGISLPRAIKWTVELKCDIVNYSFGEQVIWPNVGRISKYLNRMIHKYGIIMVASGGNNGPSLGSLSCPGGTVQGVIGVAPLVFPDMMRNLYCQPDDSSLHHQSLLEDSFNIDNETKCRNDRVDSVSRNVSTTSPTRKNAHPTNYNWGSRGPAFDGAFGLCVAAPGGANTSIASWQLKPTGLLSGSSMSAPMVTGGISLILSGLRHCYNCTNDNGLLKIPPSLIYLSLMNTSKRIEHLSYLDQGYGLMQIDTAFQYLNHILYTLYKRNDYRIIGNIENDTHVDSHDDVDNRAHSSCVDGGVSYDSLYNVQPSSSLNSRDSLCQSLGIPDPCMTYGWHIRLTVSGPGCTPQNRGIWLRRGWLLSPRAVTNTTSLPLLRYTLNMCIEFDEYVPINVRRSLELHLTTELLSEFNGLTNSNNWLQIASIITVTNTSRDIHFVIDPIRCSELLNALSKDDKMKVTTITQLLNEQNTPCNRQHLYESSLLQEGGLQPQLPPSSSSSSSSVIQQEQHRSQLSDFCWPSNLATPKVGHYGNNNNNNNNNNNSDNLPIKSQKPYVMMIGFRATDYPEMGILACLPIIVHIPHRLNRSRDLDQPHFLFSDRFDAKNKVRRWFIEVPYGATAGILRLARLDNDGDKCCEFTITINSSWIGMSSEKQEIRWSSIELNKCGQSKSGLKRNYKTLPAYNSDDFDCASQFAFPIQWETDYLELTIAQNWGLELPAIVVGELYFRGLEPSSRCIVLNTSDRYCRIGLRSNFANEAIQPDIWLTHWCLPVKPYDSKIFYLGHGTNELFVDEHSSYALRLMYQFTCPFKIVTAVICLPWLQDMLYSSDYLIHIFHVYDNRGRFIGAGEYDGRREERPKFTFNLQKGDYKVIAQICHETGPLLKRGTTKPVTLTSSSGNELHYILNKSENVDSTSVNTSWSPLQSLQNIPILIRFCLTGGMELASGGKGGSILTGKSVVRFEFSALPSSLNLNGTKACSAMDPLTYHSKQTLMVGDIGGASDILDQRDLKEKVVMESVDNCDSNRFELVRRLPCLPSRINACETISIFLGITDEKYPSYAVPGSYFSGAIGFYKSNLLHNVATYPFRLNLDHSNALSTLTTTALPSPIPTPISPVSPVTAAAVTTTEQPKQLSISYMGIGVEDLKWIQCLGDLFLFNKPLKNYCKRIEYCTIGVNHGNEISTPSIDQQSQQQQPSIHDYVQNVYQPSETVNKDEVQSFVNDQLVYNTLSKNSDFHTVSVDNSKYTNKKANGFSNSISSVTVEQKEGIDNVEKFTSLSLYDSSNQEEQHSMEGVKHEDIKEEVKHSTTCLQNDCDTNNLSEIDFCIQQETTHTVSVTSMIEMTTTANTLPTVNNQTTFKKNTYTPTEFNTILYKIHTDLCSMDKPLNDTTIIDSNSSSDSPGNEIVNHLCKILNNRLNLWYDVDYLINGRLLDEEETFSLLNKFNQLSSITTSVLERKSEISLTTKNDNIFYHLINISLPSATSSIVKNTTQVGTGTLNNNNLPLTTPGSPPSKSKVKTKDKPVCNSLPRPKSEGYVGASETERPVSDSGSNNNIQNQKPLTISSNEFKLRLIDTLSRYGRLIIERLICLNYAQNTIVMNLNKSNWSLYNMINLKFIKSNNELSNNNLLSSSSELFKYLDDIYERLIKLTSQTIMSNDTIGINVKLGNQALPGWLLLSFNNNNNSNNKHSKTETLIGMNYGSIGGRLIIFFILYMIVKQQYPEVIGYFLRLLYQIDEPPIGALKGVVNCGVVSTPTLGTRRPCCATLENSLKTAKSAHPWLLWLLQQVGWIDIAAYLKQQEPILFPERDYTLFGD